jgi:hypothetical protein
MLLTIFGNYLILLCIFGYSYFIKKFFLEKQKNFLVENLDFFYGFLFTIFLSLLLNFFFPLKYFTIPVIFIGLIFFLSGLKRNKFKLNFLFYFIILFFISAISYYGRNNIDSPMYHLQIINWINLNKINFGISNLGIRLGFNSSWHSFLGLLNLTFETYSAKYYLSSIIFAFSFYEAIRNKFIINVSNIFLYLFICYLLLFSYLHPIYYGVILNHFGNPERDIVTMFLYFISFYIFIKIFEKNDTKVKIKLTNILLISTFICVSARITTILIFLLPMYVIIKNRYYKILINFTSLFVILTGIIWIIRSFILSGCLLFPIEQTCFSTPWSVDMETLSYMVDEAKRYTRTLPYLNNLGDYDYSLNSFDWLKPWIRDYLFTTALLQINLGIIIIVSLFLIAKQIIGNFLNLNKFKLESHEIFIILLLLLSIILWMSTPEIRYAWGLHFVIPCFMLSILLKNSFFNFLKKFNRKFYMLNLILILILFLSKNISVFKIEDFASIPNRVHDFSKIRKVGTFEGIDIFYNHWKCADFKGVCVNIPNEDYKIEKKYSYVFFKKN